jgi:O-antigen/teichoic acid export membrane protein
MLLVGRVLSISTNFIVQILTVRYLTKSDYGAFAWALSITSMAASFIVFGMDKTVARFAPIYQEKHDFDKLLGSLILMVGTILALSFSLVLFIHGMREVFIHSYISNKQAFLLLLVLIFLSPIDALDSFFVGVFAVFAKPRAIFFRKYVLGPGLKLSAVLLLVLIRGNVYFLAKSYLAAGIIGGAVNISVLIRILRSQEFFRKVKLRAVKMPVREIFSFATPLLSSMLAMQLRGSIIVVLIEAFHNTSEVAAFRAVYPVARLNIIVLQSFALLFTPLAAKLFAQNDREGISDFYQKSAVWIAVISFPMFIMSFSLAEPLTVFFFGPRYAQSGVIMALLALGFYFSAAAGFNDLTLRVFGKVGYLFAIDIFTIIFGLGVCLWLIPRHGAMGAAIAASSSLIIQNIINVTALRYCSGVNMLQSSSIKRFLIIIAGTVVLLFIQLRFQPPIYISFFLAVLISLIVLQMNRDALDIVQMFPELQRFALMNRILLIPISIIHGSFNYVKVRGRRGE